MKKHLLLFFFCIVSFGAFAQILPNEYFTNPTTLICPYDSSNYEGFLEWEGFQTWDSSYAGPRDSHCLEIATPPAQQLSVFLDGGIQTLPTFIASQLNDSNKVLLDSNGLYKVSFYAYGNDSMRLLLTSMCPDGLCTGIQIGIEIPDSNGTGTDIRWYMGTATLDFSTTFLEVEFCFPTERFPLGNHIRHAYIKFTPDGLNPGVIAESNFLSVEDMKFGTEAIRALDIPFNGFEYSIHLNLFSNWQCFCSNKLLMYTAPTYPSPAHISYVEATPSPNVATQETLEVYVDFGTTLLFQPYTELRAGLVLGDTIRHILNLVNDGGTLCTYPFIDLHFEDGDGYVHRAGKVDMQGPNACMQFGKGSALTVDNGAKLQYGRPGHGMLALRSNGKVILKHNAELVIHHILAFGEYRWEDSPQKFEVHLQSGSKLIFGPEAVLTNSLSAFPDVSKLDVYMEGGTLDDSQLSPEERALIRRIYPSAHDEFAGNIKILGNPFSELLECTLTADHAMSIELELITLDGRVVSRKTQSVGKGVNRILWQQADLANGMYFLRITTPYASCSKRVSRIGD